MIARDSARGLCPGSPRENAHAETSIANLEDAIDITGRLPVLVGRVVP